MAFSTKAAGHFFSAAGKKIIDKSKYPIKKLKEFRDSEVAIQGSPKELAEKAAAIPFGMARTVGENTFRLKENPDSLLGFDINITGRAKAIAAAGIVGSAVFDIATMQTQNVGPTENGIKTATPSLNEYLDPTYSQAPSYANANADGDLVLALNKNRNG